MVNRSVVVIKGKQPFVDWINEVDPLGEIIITLKNVREDCIAYLIQDFEYDDESKKFVETNWRNFFEMQLEHWYTDPSLYPKKLTKKMFSEWFDFEIHSIVEDLVEAPIIQDE